MNQMSFWTMKQALWSILRDEFLLNCFNPDDMLCANSLNDPCILGYHNRDILQSFPFQSSHSFVSIFDDIELENSCDCCFHQRYDELLENRLIGIHPISEFFNRKFHVLKLLNKLENMQKLELNNLNRVHWQLLLDSISASLCLNSITNVLLISPSGFMMLGITLIWRRLWILNSWWPLNLMRRRLPTQSIEIYRKSSKLHIWTVFNISNPFACTNINHRTTISGNNWDLESLKPDLCEVWPPCWSLTFHNRLNRLKKEQENLN